MGLASSDRDALFLDNVHPWTQSWAGKMISELPTHKAGTSSTSFFKGLVKRESAC